MADHAVVLCGNRGRQEAVLQRIARMLDKVQIRCTVLDGIPPEPFSDDVDVYAGKIRDCGAGLVFGLGGGSVMDLAKFAAYLAKHPGHCADFDGGPAIAAKPLPMVMIPTTAGTGSEVTPYSVVNHSTTGKKFTINSPNFYPDLAIIDPHLTRSMPPEVRLATALDALVHGLEAWLSADPSDAADIQGLTAIKLVFQHLPAAMQDPTDEHLEGLARAAMEGGLAISRARTGLIHTMSVALAKYCDLPHGLLNAIITPHVMKYNLKRYHGPRIKGFRRRPDGSQLKEPVEALDFVTKFLQDLGVPAKVRLERYDDEIAAALIARVRMDKGLAQVNPRTIYDEDLRELFDGMVETGAAA